MAQAIVNKLLHGPTSRLKEAAASGDGTLPTAAADLFGIAGEQSPGASPDQKRPEPRAPDRKAASSES